MKPTVSIILFTVISGMGFGLSFWTASGVLLNLLPQSQYSVGLLMMFVALTLIIFGLCSSVFHLANKKNAWKSLARVKSSWLSREALLALIYLPLAFCFSLLLGGYLSVDIAVTKLLAVVILCLSPLVVLVTAMIYASLKTIPNWHSPLTPINYLLFSLLSGGILWMTIWSLYSPIDPTLRTYCLALMLFSLSAKILHYRQQRRSAFKSRSVIGPVQGELRILDTGHSSENFITREFGFTVARKHSQLLRCLFLLGTYGIPGILIGFCLQYAESIFAISAFASVAVGITIERWLFFAEARHVVREFYGSSLS